MYYFSSLDSPLGTITLASDGTALTGLWFDGQKYDRAGLSAQAEQADLPVFTQARQWLTRYFRAEPAGELPPLAPAGTVFQQTVWTILGEIPYGQTRTYGQIAVETAARLGRPQAAARAVGSAIGRNPISILIPCHRVIGAGGSLTGYAGGIARKRAMLALEQTGRLPERAESEAAI